MNVIVDETRVAVTLARVEQRWQEYRQKLLPLLDQYPILLPLRRDLFKPVIDTPKHVSSVDQLKHLVRRRLLRQRTNNALPHAEVLLWIAHPRSVFVKPLRRSQKS